MRASRLYWTAQSVGWAAVLGALFGLAAATGGVRGEWTPTSALVGVVGSWAAFLSASHVLRTVVLRWRDAGALQLGLAAVAASLALGALITLAAALLSASASLVQGEAPEWGTLGASAGSAAITGGMLMAWALAYVLFTTAGRLRQSEREALGLRAALAEAELASLRAQVNPHFLFNALNTVRALVATDPAAARRAVTQLAAILRGTLAAGRADTQALGAELDLARAYLDLERLRFEERLGVEIAVDEAALGVPVPALAVLTLVENAVKHGIADRPDGGAVRIEARLEGGRLRLTVENPPAPRGAAAAGTGSGLRLVRERLALLYGASASLDADLGDASACVEMILPVPRS